MAQNRPLSPHLMIYKPQLTSAMSILHRITGVALTAGSLLLVWWIAALAAGPEHFACAQAHLSAWYGKVILFGFSLAFYYHLFNGVRHLLWDFGYNLSLSGVHRTGYFVLGATAIAMVITWGLIFWCGGL